MLAILRILKTESWGNRLISVVGLLSWGQSLNQQGFDIIVAQLRMCHTQPKDFPGNPSQSKAMPTKRIPHQA